MPRSIHSIATCSPITVRSPCPAGSRIQIEKARWSQRWATPREFLSKGNASRVWNRRKPIWIAGKQTGRIRASTAPPNGKWQPCLRKKNPMLLPLPVEPFRYYQYGERVVHLDGCVEVEAAYYGLPPGWIGRGVRVQWDELYVRILDPQSGLLLREHVRQKRGWYRIQPEDHAQQTPFRVVQLLGRAGRVGTHVGTLCNLIYSQQGEVGVRRILGVLSLAKKYGTAAVDEACAAALEMGVHEYRFVRRYLERCPQAPLSLRQVDPLIRELVHYRDLIHTKTKEQSE